MNGSVLGGYLRRRRPGSDNGLGRAGWAAVAGALDSCPRLAAINGVPCGGLVAGGLEELRAPALEAGLAASLVRFLARSGATLAALDLRCAAPPRPGTRRHGGAGGGRGNSAEFDSALPGGPGVPAASCSQHSRLRTRN